MAENSRRIHMLDEIRGFAIICMIIHHTFLDIGDVLGLGWGYVVFDKLCIIQPLFWAIFIIISGICSQLSRNTIKRGIIVFLLGCGVTLVTAVIMPIFDFDDAQIYFGILHCLGACMIITGLLKRLINKIDYRAGAVICCILFLFFYRISDRELLFGLIKLPEALYQTNLTAPLGFYGPTFESADYFPILPWIFMFMFGSFVGKLAKEERLPQVMYKRHNKFLSFIGRNSLWVYIAHQPIIYTVMLVTALIIS